MKITAKRSLAAYLISPVYRPFWSVFVEHLGRFQEAKEFGPISFGIFTPAVICQRSEEKWVGELPELAVAQEHAEPGNGGGEAKNHRWFLRKPGLRLRLQQVGCQGQNPLPRVVYSAA